MPGAITIATNMAGRGTDIQLGGNADMRIKQELKEVGNESGEHDRRATEIREQVGRLKEKALGAGGLYVLGTERHESRRIDNQLRGRSGRQGDPGHSKFFLSLEDDLMRIFGTDKLDGMLQRLGLKENEAIVHSWINKALEKAQQKVEARNFDIRKNLLKFDNVMNDQRKVIFEQRLEWMRDEAVHEIIADMRHAAVEELVAKHVPPNAYPEQWDIKGLTRRAQRPHASTCRCDEWAKEEGITDAEMRDAIERRADELHGRQGRQYGAAVMRYIESRSCCRRSTISGASTWSCSTHLRRPSALRSYGQREPLNEYKTEAFAPVRGHAAPTRPDGHRVVDAGRDRSLLDPPRPFQAAIVRGRDRAYFRGKRPRWAWPRRFSHVRNVFCGHVPVVASAADPRGGGRHPARRNGGAVGALRHGGVLRDDRRRDRRVLVSVRTARANERREEST